MNRPENNFVLTDTHAHLYSEEFDTDRDEMMHRAIDAGVKRIFLPNIDASSIEPLKKLSDRYPEACFPMMGLHPCYVKDDFREQLQLIRKELHARKYHAIGEVGLDLYWDKSTFDIQREAFLTQVQWSLDLNLPLVIHSRESTRELIDLLKEVGDPRLKGIFHCFSGTLEEAVEVVSMGFYLGIGGVVTYKKSSLAEIIGNIGLEHMLLETDAPYLAPVPHRGKRNESAYIMDIALKVASIKNVSLAEVAKTTTENSFHLFGI